jgi:hypothetical protein
LYKHKSLRVVDWLSSLPDHIAEEFYCQQRQNRMAGGDVRSLKRAINYVMRNIGTLMMAPAAAYAVVGVCFEGWAGKRGQMGLSACTMKQDVWN